MSVSSSGKVQEIVAILRDRYDQIVWYSGDRDEFMIGAILARQTRWEMWPVHISWYLQKSSAQKMV